MRKTTKAKKQFIYVGPTIPGVATRNTVYGEMPRALESAIRATPYLSGLCIPVAQLAAAITQINSKQGGFYTLYKKALNESADIQKGAN